MALPKIDVPTYELDLISTGDKVKYRPFLVKEQKIFLMAAESDDPADMISAIKQVLHNCIISGADVDALPTFELEYLFLQIRSRSVGEISTLHYTCNNKVKGEDGEEKVCGGQVKIEVDVSKIVPEILPEHTNKIVISDKMGVVMKYPSFNVFKKMNSKSDVAVLDLIISCIDYIYDDDQIYYAKDASKAELNEFMEGLQPSDFAKIQMFFKTMPKIHKSVDFKCPKCGYGERIEIEGFQNFFG